MESSKLYLIYKTIFYLGDTKVLEDEINKLVRNRTTRHAFTRSAPLAPQRTSDVIEFNVDSVRPLVSFITRITPSPGWFIGVHDLDMCDRMTGDWLDLNQVQPVYAFEAVSDDGIRPIDNNHPSAPWTTQKRQLGVFHFSKMSDSGRSSTGEFESDETFICPSKASQTNMSCVIVFLTSLLVASTYSLQSSDIFS